MQSLVVFRAQEGCTMRKSRVLLGALLATALSTAALAQESTGNIAIVYTAKPKSGSWPQLEEALAKHFGWHRAHKDDFAWIVWQVISGDNMGDFTVTTFGHSWKDFDARVKFDQADDADFVPNVLPFIDKISLHYMEMIPEASRPSASQQPTPLRQLTHYFVNPSGVVRFLDALKEIKAALDKANYPVRSSWFRLVSGGEGPHYVLAVERNSWAELERPAKSLEQVLAEATSPSKAVELMAAVRDNTRKTYSEMLQLRPDLSYFPGK